MPHLPRFALVVLLAALAHAQPAAEQAVDLRPRFKEGMVSTFDVWTLRQTNTTARLNSEAPDSVRVDEHFDIKVTWKVDRVRPDGSATCTLTVDQMVITITGNDGEVTIADSRKAGDRSELARMVKALAGHPVRCEVAADGTIEKVANVDGLKRKAGEDVRVPDERDFVETASDLATLPGALASVVVGKGWDAAFAWNHELGTLHHSMKYTLESVEEIAGIPVATVTGQSTSSLEVDRTKIPAGVTADARLLRGSATTQVMFDLQRHEAVGRNTIETRELEVKVRAGDLQMTRTMAQTIQSQTLRTSER